MALEKTTILPADDREKAREGYKTEIERNNALFVALGDTEETGRVVENANRIAGRRTDPRHVVWAKNPKQISDLIHDHPRSEGIDEIDTETPDKAFSVGRSGTIRFVIKSEEPEPDNVKIFEAFLYAERDSD